MSEDEREKKYCPHFCPQIREKIYKDSTSHQIVAKFLIATLG